MEPINETKLTADHLSVKLLQPLFVVTEAAGNLSAGFEERRGEFGDDPFRGH